MEAVPAWKWFLAGAFLVAAAFCSGTETALTALGEARARQLRDEGSRRGRMLGIWVEHTERVLSTLLIGNTLVHIGLGALSAAIGAALAGGMGWNVATTAIGVTGLTTVVVLFLGEIIPKTVAKRHPVKVSLAAIPVVQLATWLLWPVTAAVTRITSAAVSLFGAGKAAPAVTSEEIEYLIEMGSREGVLDAVKEELLNSVLEFADRVAKEIMIPRTRMVGIDRDAEPAEIVRSATENPYSRMPVYRGSLDEVVGVLLVRELVQELGKGPLRADALDHLVKPAYFVPEGMKVSRLLKEMQRRHTHLAIVVDEFGGTSGLVTLEDVLEEIVGEIQDEGDAESAPVKAIAPGVWACDAGVPLHDLEGVLNEGAGREGGPPEVHFPEEADYRTLGGFVTATAGRVPPVGTVLPWDGLVFTVRAGDERRVTRVEIARAVPEAAPTPAPAPAAAVARSA